MSIRSLSLLSLALAVAISTAFAGASVQVVAGDQTVVLAKANKSEGAFLGIVPAEVTSDISGDYGVEAGQGVVVEETVSGSPADEAGLRTNDVLTMLNFVRLTGPAELRVQLDKYKAGDEVNLVYVRGGKERTAVVKLEGRDSDEFSWSWSGNDEELHHKLEAIVPPNAPFPMGKNWVEKHGAQMAFAGVVTQELSDGLKSYFKVEGGALISEVVKDSPAEKAGLKAGDIITKIGAESVADQGDVTAAIRDTDPDETVDFHIMRDGKSMVIPVTLTNRKDFYGDAGDGEWYFGFGEAEAEQLAVEMEKLQEEMHRVGVELDNVPNGDFRLQIDSDAPRVSISSGEARAINGNSGWWNMSFAELREGLRTGMQQLKKDLEVLKQELKQLQQEVKQRMSSFWGVQVDITPQA